MAVTMRLTRVGGRKDPVWRVVVADQRSPRDGRFIETVGRYNAQTEPVDDRARRGAHPLLARPGRPALRHGQEAPADAGHLTRDATPLRELLEYLAQALVDEPDKVKVEEFEEDDGTVVLELSVDEDDYGQIIGRGGRTAQALRTVVKAAAVEDKPRPRRHRRLRPGGASAARTASTAPST